ncbi:MAG: signal peptidase II [Gemmatimonadaceae bacterium]
MERRPPDADTSVAAAIPHRGAPLAPLPNGFLFWPVALVVILVDVVTKAIAAAVLIPALIPHPVIGEVARLTLVYNRGAAFGIHVGAYSRPIFAILTVGALAILWRLYRATTVGDRRRVLALALVSAGAVGNLIDRLRSSKGVVDFIDIGLATWRWPTFNVADIAVTTGAVLLAVVLWHEDRVAGREPSPAESSTDDGVGSLAPGEARVPASAERRGIA